MALTTVPVELANLDGAVTVNESSADADFRVESNGSANMLFVDGGNDEVVVQRASSGATATAGSVLIVEDDDNAEISILGGSSSVLALNFGHSGDPDDAIISYNTTSGSEAMAFTVNAAERMRIDSSGNVGIGATPSSNSGWARYLSIKGAAHNAIVVDGTNSQEGAMGAIDGLYIDVTGHTTATNNKIIFRTQSANSNVNGIERMRITSDGSLLVGTTASLGSLSNTNPVTAGKFRSFSDVVAATHNTPTTMFSLPSGLGTYIITAGFNGIGNTAAYSTLAIVHGDGTSYKLTSLTTSTSMSWDISGSNVRIQQSSGSTLNVSVSMIRIQ